MIPPRFSACAALRPYTVISIALRLLIFATAAFALRAAQAQPSPGQRGDPYSPLGSQQQVEQRYPLPPPNFGPLPAPAPVVQPREAQPRQAGVEPASAPPVQPPTGDELYQPSRIVATVGSQFILLGEVAPTVELVLAPVLAQVKTEEDRRELEKVRANLTRQIVRQIIDTKLMYLEFERQIEKNAGRDKLDEARKTIGVKMRDSFEKELEQMRQQVATAKPDKIQTLIQRDPIVPRLAVLMRDANAETLNELDALLRQYGSSLDKQLRMYGENRLGRDIVRRQIFTNQEVTHQEMLDHYEAHAADFAVPAKARFEILTVKFASFGTKLEAWNQLAQMGNEVFFGAPFAAIARKHSQEPHSDQGGFYDWTTKGSLASKPIDAAIFALEPGKLSQPIEDERGYHIVRVIERQEAGQIDFIEAQPTIKEEIVSDRREADTKKVLTGLQTKTQVWTIYDEPAEVAQQPGATRR